MIQTLGLDLPSIAELKKERAAKDVPFPNAEGGTSTPFIIYSSMNDWQNAITASLPGSNTTPTSDPTKSSLVFSGIRWLGNTLPEADIEVRQPAGEASEEDDEPIEDHPLLNLFKRPNPFMSASTLWKAFAYSWIINGNVYWVKFRNNSGQVVQLWNEPYWRVRPRWVNDQKGEYITVDKSTSLRSVEIPDTPDQFINYYEVERDSQFYRVAVADVVHFRDGEDPYNRRLGMSGVNLILREIFGDSAAADYAGGVLAGKGVPPGVLSVDNKLQELTQEDIEGISSSLERKIQQGKTLVVSNAKYERMGLTPEEIDARVSRYMSEERFSAVTGIPLEVLNLGAGNEHSTYSNVTEAERTATQRYLVPLWWHIDQELTHQLLRDFDENEEHFVEHCLDEVGALQEDQNAKYARVGKAYQDGFIMRSEARTMVGLESEDGDEVYFARTGSETLSIEDEEEKRNAPEPETNPLSLVGAQPRKLLNGAPARVKEFYNAK